MHTLSKLKQSDTLTRALQQMLLVKNSKPSTVIVGMAVGVGCLMTPYAQAEDMPYAQAEDMPSAVLPAINVTVDMQSEPVYPSGQVTYTNHIGFLENKNFLETPFSAISYTETFIEDTQAADITDVIAKTDPAIYSSDIEGENVENYKMRGFTSTLEDATVNGLYGIAPFFRSSPEMFERVEVLKGPSAMLNGMAPKGSVGGAINLVPKRATDTPLTRVTAQYLSDSRLGGHIDVGRRFGDNNEFGVRVNGVYRNGDTPIDDQKRRIGLASLALDYRGDGAEVSLDVYHTQEKVNAPTRGIQLAPGIKLPKPPSADTQLSPVWAYNDEKNTGVMLKGEYYINEYASVYGAAGRSNTDFDSQSASRATITNAAGDYTTSFGEVGDDRVRKSGEIGLKGYFDTGAVSHQLAVNATRFKDDYNLNARFFKDIENTTNIYHPTWAAFNQPFKPDALVNIKTDLTSYGIADTLLFAEDKYQLTLGARHQKVAVDESGRLASGVGYDESATTPSVAGVVKLNDELSVYANYIEGLSKGDNAPVDAVNAGEIFAPYKTKQKEIGVKVDLGTFAHTLSAYEIKQPNSYLDPVSQVFSSGGEQRNRGVEWSFFGTPMADVRLMGGVAYVDATLTRTVTKTDEGNEAIGVPKWQGKLGAEWDQPYLNNLTLTGNLTSVSDYYVDRSNIVSVPGHTVFDLGARYKTEAWQYPLTVRADLTNAFGKDYWAKPYYLPLGLGQPRTLKVSATVDF